MKNKEGRWFFRSSEERKASFDHLGFNLSEEEVHANKLIVPQRLSEFGEECRLLGIQDGRTLQDPSRFHVVAYNQAARCRTILESIFKGGEAAAIENKKVENTRREAAKGLADKQQGYVDELEQVSKRHPERFNWGMGLVYLCIAVMLLLADLPLAFDLMENAFEIEIDGGQSVDIFSIILGTEDNENSKEDGINLEGLFLALGICLFTIYVKIYYDEFLGASIEKSTMHYQRDHLISTVRVPQFRAIGRAWYMRLAVKTILLGVLITSLVFMGFLRTRQFDESPYQSTQTAGGVEGSDQSSSESNQEKLPRNGDQYYVGGGVIDVEDEEDAVRLWSFILITILFPVISGVCASLGVDRIQNMVTLLTARWRLNMREKRLSRINRSHREAADEASGYTSFREWCSDRSGFINDYKEYFYACYAYGYGQVWTEDVNGDLFDRANLYHQRLLTVRSSEIALRKRG